MPTFAVISTDTVTPAAWVEADTWRQAIKAYTEKAASQGDFIAVDSTHVRRGDAKSIVRTSTTVTELNVLTGEPVVPPDPVP